MTHHEDGHVDIDALFDVSGKVAVVTGGYRGIGRMITEGLLKAGVRCYITGRKADQLEEAAEELSEFGEVVAIPGDLSDEAGCKEFAAAVAEQEDEVHILVNNAGAAWGESIDEYSESGFDKVLAVNVKGVFMMTKSLLPQLRAAGTHDDPARVINIGSIDGLSVPALESYAYSASKAGVHHMGRHIASRLAEDHITVNAIAPGLFESNMTAFMFDDLSENAEEIFPLQRTGRPDDMAGAVLFLASRAGSYVTGAVIPVDGGSATLR
ncbi:MAG: SDR family oxidoreductase [Nitriliruptorales bacterium]|nr:SDR family oxidoreductase [Nitriliruptorales bacterium]